MPQATIELFFLHPNIFNGFLINKASSLCYREKTVSAENEPTLMGHKPCWPLPQRPTNDLPFFLDFQLDGSLMDSPSCQASGSMAAPPRASATTTCNPDKWKLQEQQCDQLEVYEPGTACTFNVSDPKNHYLIRATLVANVVIFIRFSMSYLYDYVSVFFGRCRYRAKSGKRLVLSNFVRKKYF